MNIIRPPFAKLILRCFRWTCSSFCILLRGAVAAIRYDHAPSLKAGAPNNDIFRDL